MIGCVIVRGRAAWLFFPSHLVAVVGAATRLSTSRLRASRGSRSSGRPNSGDSSHHLRLDHYRHISLLGIALAG